MSKHGWRIKNRKYKDCLVVEGKLDFSTVSVFPATVSATRPMIARVYGKTPEEREARARLIAAAPQMAEDLAAKDALIGELVGVIREGRHFEVEPTNSRVLADYRDLLEWRGEVLAKAKKQAEGGAS